MFHTLIYPCLISFIALYNQLTQDPENVIHNNNNGQPINNINQAFRAVAGLSPDQYRLLAGRLNVNNLMERSSQQVQNLLQNQILEAIKIRITMNKIKV